MAPAGCNGERYLTDNDHVWVEVLYTYKPIESSDYVPWQWHDEKMPRSAVEDFLNRRRQKVGGIGMTEYKIWTMESHQYER